MLSRAQEARVRDVLANHPPGTIQTYCFEHLAAAAKIPPGHLADLAAFIRSLREHGADCARDCDSHCAALVKIAFAQPCELQASEAYRSLTPHGK